MSIEYCLSFFMNFKTIFLTKITATLDKCFLTNVERSSSLYEARLNLIL